MLIDQLGVFSIRRYLPKKVAKVVKRLGSSSVKECQYPAVRSLVEKIFARASSCIKSSRIGSWCEDLTEGYAFSSTLRFTVPGRAPRSLAKASG